MWGVFYVPKNLQAGDLEVKREHVAKQHLSFLLPYYLTCSIQLSRNKVKELVKYFIKRLTNLMYSIKMKA